MKQTHDIRLGDKFLSVTMENNQILMIEDQHGNIIDMSEKAIDELTDMMNEGLANYCG